MIPYEDILIEPVLSEKANMLREQGKYVFRVNPKATKVQIKDAVEKMFVGTKVDKVNTINLLGKKKIRRGYRPGKTKDRKKDMGKTVAPGKKRV